MSFILNDKITATADIKMNSDTVKKLWRGFALTLSDIEFEKGDNFTFRVGVTRLPVLTPQKEYALSVTDSGIAIVGRDFGGLMRGFMSLIMKIEYDGEKPYINAVTEESAFIIKNRMLHVCVFPENDLYFIKKLKH